MRILVVDDEESIRALLVLFLEELDKSFEIITASNGEEALNKFKEFEPSIIVTDIKMPVMDGITMLKEIKKIDTNNEVIVISAHGDMDVAIDALKLSASDYLLKPISQDALEVSLKRAVEKINIKHQLQEYTENLEQMVADRTEQLINAEKFAAIGRLEQGILHNIANPLSGIAVLSECLISALEKEKKKIDAYDYEFDSEILQKSIDIFIAQSQTIKKSSENITKIIKNLMSKSRDEQSVYKEELNLNNLIEQELEFLQADLTYKHEVEKVVELDPNMVSINAVYSDFSQTFSNLIKNALDAMHGLEEKNIIIRSSMDDKNIFIEVIDSGRGIPKDKIDQIFEPFYSTKPKESDAQLNEPRGTGLGLYECYKMMKEYNGTIEVQSVLNQGAAFKIVIPKRGNVV